MKIHRLLPHLVSILSTRILRTAILPVVLAFVALLSLPGFAQDAPEALRPPKGAQFAIVVFEDLQCPQCGRVAPVLAMASRNYKIPLVQHDFPLPLHNWSMDAAIMARYFDTSSKTLGNEFRDYIFQSQLEINLQNLRAYAEKFATAHKVDQIGRAHV